MKRVQVAILALSTLSLTNAFAVDSDAVLGGAIGGGVGAAIGSEVGGREGAIVGSGVGAAVGTAIATDGKEDSSGQNKRTHRPRDYDEYDHAEVDYVPPRRHARPRIPRGHMPPPGLCRVWYPGRPPGHQPPPGNCHALRHQAPPGAWLVRG
jgi:hypothetical protein